MDEYLVVWLKRIARPFYYPRSFSVDMLHQVISEAVDPRNWHYYEIEPTRVQSTDHVADCGAAEGVFSLLAAPRCQKVYAIEPLPAHVRALSLTFTDSNVSVLPYALSSSNYVSRLNESEMLTSLTPDGNGPQVDVRTIDTLFLERQIPISYLKADLEGQDFEMLKGALGTIKANKPRIAITTYHHPDHARLMANFLKSIDPNYCIKVKGIYHVTGCPVMLHAWIAS